ncbi:hypothetical protein GGI55_006256 [Rhizobium leguminosarum]|nr:hypothetical protein [Rhizobium leguminosarum]MBB4545546.1 hypothetical protein [Rhizobium leguminosarum]MBB5683166.1 hypothetical protein [Rhizobium leguminosarum]MBB6268901.1 hypothetical protein [Rhizobium leguminosarum]
MSQKMPHLTDWRLPIYSRSAKSSRAEAEGARYPDREARQPSTIASHKRLGE